MILGQDFWRPGGQKPRAVRRPARTKTYLHEIKELKRSNSSEELERLLLGLIDPVEAQERIDGYGLAYYYTEQMAILYRKKGNI